MPSSSNNSASHQNTASVTTALRTIRIVVAMEPYFSAIAWRMASECVWRAPSGDVNLYWLQLCCQMLLMDLEAAICVLRASVTQLTNDEEREFWICVKEAGVCWNAFVETSGFDETVFFLNGEDLETLEMSLLAEEREVGRETILEPGRRRCPWGNLLHILRDVFETRCAEVPQFRKKGGS